VSEDVTVEFQRFYMKVMAPILSADEPMTDPVYRNLTDWQATFRIENGACSQCSH